MMHFSSPNNDALSTNSVSIFTKNSSSSFKVYPMHIFKAFWSYSFSIFLFSISISLVLTSLVCFINFLYIFFQCFRALSSGLCSGSDSLAANCSSIHYEMSYNCWNSAVITSHAFPLSISTNTKLTSIEDWITSNHDDLMARIANNKIRLNDALNITKKNIIMKQYTEKKNH